MALPPKDRKHFESAIPNDLRLFEATDIDRMFTYMEETFHLSKKWKTVFSLELQKTERSISEQEFFFRFARKHLDPPLQQLLVRKDSVVIAMARFLIRDRIREKRKEAEGR
ncbi:MAG TPA: hypothetical protein VIM75_09795 [Ohtaekwangia sp.]|uniref:hypothetical protein n=1 Tax=Ohtaekwangia sp. TaxID=2066019 RepID=UPI002F9531E8